LTNLTHQAGTTDLATYSYMLNAGGQRTNAVEILLQENGTYLTNTLSWQYDGLNRLTNEVLVCSTSSASYTNSYSYDLAGNRVSKVHAGNSPETITYQYNPNDELTNEISSVNPTVTYLYDANGSLTNKTAGTTVNSYAYNLENKLATVAINGVTSAAYQYDSQGVRISSTIGGNTTNYLIDANNLTGYPQILEELPAVGGTPAKSYVIGNEVLAQSASGTLSYFLKDGHGNNRQLTSASGTVTSHYNYDAYGVVQTGISSTTAEAAPTSLLYCGEQYDSVLQMYNLRARYYNPTVGRFGVQDQVDGTPDDPLNLHKYIYCQNNPVNMHDPSGNQGDICSMTFAMSIMSTLDSFYNGTVGKVGDMLKTSAEASAESINHIEDDGSKSDTATIIIHGVEGADIGGGHKYGWSKPFQHRLSDDPGTGEATDLGSQPLNQDFYEFNWGGFSADMSGPLVIGVIPVKSVHQFAFINLQTAQLLIWMKGYNDMNVISHSWGTCLAYDMLNSGGIEMHDWVTMGSPLKHDINKPVWNSGPWINAYSTRDPVVYLDMYPGFIPTFGKGLIGHPQVDPPAIITTSGSGGPSLPEHTAYWTNPGLLTSLRNRLQ